MWVQIYRESGYEEAARATRLSRESTEQSDTIGDNLGTADEELFKRLLRSESQGGTIGQPHSVGLRQIVFWLGVSAPLYWWKHMDRYTVGKDQASASTMYNLMKRPLTQSDFEGTIFIETLDLLNKNIEQGNFDIVNRNLPHSYLQERSLMISLPTMRRIIQQRRSHKLLAWQYFIDTIVHQARYPLLLLC